MRSSKAFIIGLIVTMIVIIGVVLAVVLMNTKKTSPAASVDTSSAVATNTVAIKGFAFSPATITVKAGTTVTWTNNDAVRHSVTSDDGSAFTFDSGLIDSKATTTVTFSKAGTFPYHCTPHPYMKAVVIVT